jgi:hypothetical protein
MNLNGIWCLELLCSGPYRTGRSGEQALRPPSPVIPEGGRPLAPRLQHEPDERKKPRLQMLYRLASGQAQTRQWLTGDAYFIEAIHALNA